MHPFLQLAGPDGAGVGELSPTLRDAVLGQFERQPARRVARDLGRMLSAPWWVVLPPDDRVRATRIVAHVSARASGAPVETMRPCTRTILEGTLDSLLPPQGRFGLRFDDLPLEGQRVVAGLREPPATVVLNRAAIRTCDARLGDGDPLELRVGLATLVHEVNHLHNLTPVGPTYEAYQDEYRAWWVDFVAHVGRRPRVAEARARCRELIHGPEYEPLRRAATEASGHGARIREHVASLDGGDLTAEAPLPESPLDGPLGSLNLDNAPRFDPA
ncbi:hypothetical protein [Paraliomyxa miuraensis]|uniref:hypothetical protein n=1 Tax=Paraliomyxa miuraensis TaxID=376150 RepID=UPI0022587AEF|nr:hypothetical protein [Paraliomyxa miuraensis]MCX4247483.1 hypothetical protein [Paraliomyxa miuraensis]